MKYLLLFFALLVTISVHGQMTLEKTYTHMYDQGLRVVQFTNYGYKYIVEDPEHNLVRLYNTDHSIWKTINCTVSSGFSIGNTSLVSDNLFNSDGLVEILYYVVDSISGNVRFYVINETGASLYSGNGLPYEIKFVDTNVKLVVRSADSLSVYALPGTIPCNACNGGTSGISLKQGGPNESQLSVSPNPNNGAATISYILPRGSEKGDIIIYNLSGKEVKQYVVDNAFGSLTLSTADLPSGIYLYQLKAGNNSQTKKMIVIK